jgi:tetratricopeptide (TPR) repeat protein
MSSRWAFSHLKSSILFERIAMTRYPQSSKVEQLAKEGDYFFYSGQRKNAILCYTKALEVEPDCVYILVQRGLALQEEHHLDEAISDYEKALKLDSNYGMAYYGRGWARHWQSDFNGELQDAQIGLQLDPTNRGPYLRRIGAAQSGLKIFHEAIAAYSEAIEIQPLDEGTIYNRGICYYEIEMYKEAIKDFDRALELDSDWSWALTYRAMAYAKLGQLEKASNDVNLALKYDPAYEYGHNVKKWIDAKVKNQKKGFWEGLFS